MGGVVDSSDGLPVLERLDFSNSRAGKGMGSLVRALRSGKLGALAEMKLNNSNMPEEAIRDLSAGVREGGLSGISSLQLKSNPDQRRGGRMWGEFMQAIAESQRGLPKLQYLDFSGHEDFAIGKPVIAALASGNVRLLKRLDFESFPPTAGITLSGGSLGILCEGVREGMFPPGLKADMRLKIDPREGSFDSLLTAIAESKTGLPPCISSLDFGGLKSVMRGARFSEEALAILAASGGRNSAGKLSHLEEVNMSYCDIDDQKLKRLGEVFSAYGCSSLKFLDLRWIPAVCRGDLYKTKRRPCSSAPLNHLSLIT
uniref:Uncharacterized protein n=1 Tax=Chromera velia CCMP2878 TaxID=1169474 RepID=A0A0G4IF13_9ALVE|eukprot:Cvel_13901.t1-p1 / transcript=Cvel_13901.t1 / gene=Cvel_13901 / organism=Chromera_velia_CCMP2878 / gene_product=hypothetical protein / transcript_product=hypothetical protein / location=Cvel_scaffold968:40944-41882(+) / protein_length=313 / sequence_SO=supercontig / SO=protein_coding / is_pseudo=false